MVELGAEVPGYSVAVLTHFPQGLGKELDKALTAKAKEQHLALLNEALKQDDTAFEDFMAGVSSSLREKGVAPDNATIPGWQNSYFTSATYTGSRPSANYFSIAYMIYWYNGGPHPNRAYKVWAYDVRNGKELTLKDLFPSREGVESALAGLAITALSDRVKDLTEDMMDINIRRISLTANGLRIVYSPYEIASYAEGEFFVDIPLKALEPLGVNAAIWGRYSL